MSKICCFSSQEVFWFSSHSCLWAWNHYAVRTETVYISVVTHCW